MVFMWLLFEVRDISEYFISHQTDSEKKSDISTQISISKKFRCSRGNRWVDSETDDNAAMILTGHIFNCFVNDNYANNIHKPSGGTKSRAGRWLFGENTLLDLFWVIWIELIIFHPVTYHICANSMSNANNQKRRCRKIDLTAAKSSCRFTKLKKRMNC